jgi:hypothetical protein
MAQDSFDLAEPPFQSKCRLVRRGDRPVILMNSNDVAELDLAGAVNI